MRVDRWSFGIELYEMLAGLPAFYGGQFRRLLSHFVTQGDC
jgi:serine/threonine protein kinase